MSKHREPRVWIDVTADTQVMIDAGGRPPGAVMPAGDWEWTVCFPSWKDAAAFHDKLVKILVETDPVRKAREAQIKHVPNDMPTIAFPNANASPPAVPSGVVNGGSGYVAGGPVPVAVDVGFVADGKPVVLINGVVTPLPLFGAQRLETAPFSSVVPIACDENDDLTVAELAEIDDRIPPSAMDSLQATAAAAVPPITVTLRPATWRDRPSML